MRFSVSLEDVHALLAFAVGAAIYVQSRQAEECRAARDLAQRLLHGSVSRAVAVSRQ
jgi:predicted membrane-bound mannosyltransferase